MTINLSAGLTALSVLSGTNTFTALDGTDTTADTKATRQAKALFTTKPTTPPWKQANPVSTNVSAVTALHTIIDKPATGNSTLPADVQTDFIAYKALDRLRLLAQTAASTATSAAQRATLQTSFAKGLGDLQAFLASAPADKLHLAFGQPSTHADSVGMFNPTKLTSTAIHNKGVATARDTAIPGLSGTEKLRISLSDERGSDQIDVDLASAPQPPTIDGVAAAINSAIAAVQLRAPDGTVALDENGMPNPRWLVHFVPDKTTDKWGFSVQRSGAQKVSIDQVGAPDALMVATGVTALDAPTAARIIRFDDPAGTGAPTTLATLDAVDRDATARAQLVAAATAKPVTTTKTTATTPVAPPPVIHAATSADGVAVDGQGFTYVVGTTRGDIGSNVSLGNDDLYLSKRDSNGAVVWQRSLGATGTAQGAAISIAPDGGIVVAGTVSGSFDGANSDGDMLVTRFDGNGDQTFSTLVRSAGADRAGAIAVGQDGSIYVGGQSAANGGDAFVARLDAAGHLQERRTIDSGGSEGVTALAVDPDGQLLVLARESGSAKLHRLDGANLGTELGSIDLGVADAHVLAVDSDGSIAVGGTTLAALSGDQINGLGGARDGFVTRIAGDLSGASTTYLASAGNDQVDSLAFMGGALYVGGRTTGALDGARRGAVDGFVGRIDPASGAIENVHQFGQAATQTEPVRVAAAVGGDTALGALGLHRGLLTPQDSAALVAQTGLRAGDEFSLKIDGSRTVKFTIAADDTLATLSQRIGLRTSGKAVVTMPISGDLKSLRITAKAGSTIELVPGGAGKDALAKLGMAAGQVAMPAKTIGPRPKVTPGGSFGLDLTTSLGIGTIKDANIALARVKAAISTSQTGYRSLYWDSTKALLANAGTSSGAKNIGSAAAVGRANAQLAQYQAALNRLTGGA
jgi:hypothetical protein